MASIKVLNILKKTNIYHSQSINNLLIIKDYEKVNFPQIISRSIKRWRGRTIKKIVSTPEVLANDPIIESVRESYGKTVIPPELSELRFAYPEFLPNPVLQYRNKTYDKLMRLDLIRRRTVLDIPEFYVGSIVAVTVSDPYAPGKVSKFVGICIERQGQGTYANFTLRNRVDGQGVEIRYDLYNPTIREIQVLKLEKRLDSELLYLRDALPEYSYFPFDMTPEPHIAGQPVPVNPLKVVMKKWPWTQKWELYDFKGIQLLPDLPDYEYINKWKIKNQYDKYDLMKQYRQHIPEDEQLEIWQEVKEHQQNVAEIRKIERRKKLVSQTVKQTKT